MAMKKGLAERLAQGPLAARLRTSLRDKIAAADNRIGKLRLRITRFGDEIEEARPEAEKAERMRDALPATARSEFARFDRRARDRRAYIAFREAWIADDERTIAAVEAARQADQAQLDGLPAPITRNQKASDADVDVGRVERIHAAVRTFAEDGRIAPETVIDEHGLICETPDLGAEGPLYTENGEIRTVGQAIAEAEGTPSSEALPRASDITARGEVEARTFMWGITPGLYAAIQSESGAYLSREYPFLGKNEDVYRAVPGHREAIEALAAPKYAARVWTRAMFWGLFAWAGHERPIEKAEYDEQRRQWMETLKKILEG